MLITTLFALQRQQTGFRGNLLAVNVPVVSHTRKPADVARFYQEAIRRISELPDVDRVALGAVVPWRDPGFFAAQFTVEGYRKVNGEEDPRAQFRTVSPGFFSALGVKLVAGRDFNDGDRADSEKVVHPIEQEMSAGRLFIHAKMDPYALVPPVTKVIRDLASDQPVERAATLDDIRAEVLAPTRVNALVFGGFAGVALLIAIVGVAGVLAFSVSAGTREFGVRLAIGSTPMHLLARPREGAAVGIGGIVAGAIGGVLLSRIVGSFVPDVQMPGLAPIAGAALMLAVAAIRVSDGGGARLASGCRRCVESRVASGDGASRWRHDRLACRGQEAGWPEGRLLLM